MIETVCALPLDYQAEWARIRPIVERHMRYALEQARCTDVTFEEPTYVDGYMSDDGHDVEPHYRFRAVGVPNDEHL